MEKIYREDENGAIIKGVGLPAFIHNFSYHLVLIKVYEDGIIDCWEKLDFDGFVDKVESGWVVTTVPKGSEISRHHSFFCKSTDINTYIDEQEFIKEVRDTLDTLQGRKSSSERCWNSFISYINNPTEIGKVKLETEYKLIPEHLKRYVLGDMDSKDGPIKYILNNEVMDQKVIDEFKEYYENH